MFKKILFLLTILVFFSCNSSKKYVRTTKKTPPKTNKSVATKKPVTTKKPVATTNSNSNGRQEVIESTSKTVVYSDVVFNYVNDFKDIAKGNMKTYGIPASIILAQGILESGAGRGELAKNSNNHFGIKCHTGWTGETVHHDDDAAQECFRKYKDPAESYKDHALFLTGRSRYASLFQLEKDDYEAWAKGLRKAGYATDPKYPEKLIGYIERYNLHQYDAEVLGNNFVPSEKSNKPIQIADHQVGNLYEVQKGDTFYSISKKFNLTVDELKKKNNLSDNTLSIGQKLIIK
ncbi:flagellum-specific peptidoglycan hydrolase FlgJ [Flavobacterium arsenatis]|uniref:Peptidoglycan hydrolase n=1 Tax=Flavobacterium arsenatis TaxID=1484332 RepID=A0ABU1TM41_9FLAO|nr:glucosaminidase domain-containing protein [Flavobacterium arsenatis]MDR6966948.1 flagellum-specific peptidoglycan hydrolase FlgJ [Flavobacterium arsenatis]